MPSSSRWIGVCSALLLASVATAQAGEAPAASRGAHRATWSRTGWLKGEGRLVLGPTREGEAMTLIWHHSGRAAPPYYTREVMPFEYAGDIALVDEGSPSRFLVSGFGPTEGWLVLVSVTDRPQPTITTLQKVALAGQDPQCVVWSDETIFVIDGMGQRLTAAPWDGSSALPTAFATVLERGSHPGPLGAPRLDLLPAREGVLLADSGSCMGGTHIHRDGATWVAEPVSFEAHPMDWGAIPAAGPLVINGPIGSFEIVDDFTGTRVGSGMLDFEWQERVVELARELIPGHRHLVTFPGHEPLVFFPTVRHGTPSVAPGFAAGRGRVNATRIGDSFSASTRFRRDDTSDHETIAASLWLSLRDVDGQDPVSPAPPVLAGAAALLTPLATMDFPADFALGSDVSPCGLRWTGDDDPALEGLVLLYQFVAITPDERGYVVSDVFGTTILAAGTDLRREERDRSRPPPRVWADMSLARRMEAYAKGAAWLARLSQTIPGRERTVRETIEALR